MKPWPNWYTPPRGARVSIAQTLISKAAQLTDCQPDNVTGRSRKPKYVGVRSAVAIVLKERGWSYHKIGAALGGRDHSTISHACTTFHDRTRRYEEWLGYLADLRDVGMVL